MIIVHIMALVVHPQRRAVVAVAFVGFEPAEPVMMFQVSNTVPLALYGIAAQAWAYCKITRAARN